MFLFDIRCCPNSRVYKTIGLCWKPNEKGVPFFHVNESILKQVLDRNGMDKEILVRFLRCIQLLFQITMYGWDS